MHALVNNAGSSSIKSTCINTQTGESIFSARAENLKTPDSTVTVVFGGQKSTLAVGSNLQHTEAIENILVALKMSNVISFKDIEVVAHRFVNCGPNHLETLLIDDSNITELNTLIHFAPLHNPAALKCVETCKRVIGDIPQVAVFDTSFHSTLSGEYRYYAIPKKYSDQIQKYGAHGTSYQYLINTLSQSVGETPQNVIIAHLGNGSSVCAIKDGKSKWTSMGQTPLAGCLGGTRSGSIDPAVVQFLVNNYGVNVDEAVDILNKESGLFAIAGNSNMVNVVKGYEDGDADCILALNLYCTSVAENIAKGILALGSKPSHIVFSGGIGENAPLVRKLICEKLNAIMPELQLSDDTNSKNDMEIISSCTSKIEVRVIKTNEELQIALEAESLVS